MMGRKVDSKTFESLGSYAEFKIAKPAVAGPYSTRISESKSSFIKTLVVR